MSFCATWVLFDSSGRSLRSQQRNGPSSLNLFCEVGLELFSSKVISLRPLSGPEVTSKESHYLTPNCCGNFLTNIITEYETTLSPYYNNKVFILLQEKISSSQIIHMS